MKNQVKKILITGSESGLGKSLMETVPNTTGLNRENCKDVLDSDTFYECIVHCAFSRSKRGEDLEGIIKDNILLTKTLLNLNYKKFIFISSIDVYQDEKNLYSASKILCESMVKSHGSNNLIVRCGAMLGPNMKSNSLIKILDKDNITPITLHPKSTFYYILHSDITDFILHSLKNNITGVVDFVSSSQVTLQQVTQALSLDCSFGSYIYSSPIVSNNKTVKVFPQADKQGLDIVIDFSKTL